MWLTSPAMVSMHTFLIRLGDKQLDFKSVESLKKAFKILHDEAKTQGKADNDTSYLGTHWDKLHLVVENRFELFGETNAQKTFFDDCPIGTFHDNAGILNLTRCTTHNKELDAKMKELTKK